MKKYFELLKGLFKRGDYIYGSSGVYDYRIRKVRSKTLKDTYTLDVKSVCSLFFSGYSLYYGTKENCIINMNGLIGNEKN